jgi:hypothetical protein
VTTPPARVATVARAPRPGLVYLPDFLSVSQVDRHLSLLIRRFGAAIESLAHKAIDSVAARGTTLVGTDLAGFVVKVLEQVDFTGPSPSRINARIAVGAV